MHQDSDTPDGSDERRRYFRIDDSVNLSLSPVPEGELDARLKRLQQDAAGSFGLMGGLTAIDQQVSACLRRIEGKEPDVADYLKAMDRKLNLLVRAFLAEELDVSDKPPRAVNLSAGGLSVHSREPFDAGTVLEIQMLMLPSYTGILAYGTVVECAEPDAAQAEPGYPYLLRIDFSFMRDVDRDVLIRHVLLKQAEWLRERRVAREQR
jgi:hypothetical protein